MLSMVMFFSKTKWFVFVHKPRQSSISGRCRLVEWTTFSPLPQNWIEFTQEHSCRMRTVRCSGHLIGGVCLGGVCPKGGVYNSSPRGQIDTCENITFGSPSPLLPSPPAERFRSNHSQEDFYLQGLKRIKLKLKP